MGNSAPSEQEPLPAWNSDAVQDFTADRALCLVQDRFILFTLKSGEQFTPRCCSEPLEGLLEQGVVSTELKVLEDARTVLVVQTRDKVPPDVAADSQWHLCFFDLATCQLLTSLTTSNHLRARAIPFLHGLCLVKIDWKLDLICPRFTDPQDTENRAPLLLTVPALDGTAASQLRPLIDNLVLASFEATLHNLHAIYRLELETVQVSDSQSQKPAAKWTLVWRWYEIDSIPYSVCIALSTTCFLFGGSRSLVLLRLPTAEATEEGKQDQPQQVSRAVFTMRHHVNQLCCDPAREFIAVSFDVAPLTYDQVYVYRTEDVLQAAQESKELEFTAATPLLHFPQIHGFAEGMLFCGAAQGSYPNLILNAYRVPADRSAKYRGGRPLFLWQYSAAAQINTWAVEPGRLFVEERQLTKTGERPTELKVFGTETGDVLQSVTAEAVHKLVPAASGTAAATIRWAVLPVAAAAWSERIQQELVLVSPAAGVRQLIADYVGPPPSSPRLLQS